MFNEVKGDCKRSSFSCYKYQKERNRGMPENSFEREVLDRLTKIEVKLDSYDKIKDQVYDNQRSIIKLYEETGQQQQQIDELRERNKWLARSILGAIIAAGTSIITLFIKFEMGA